MIGAKFLIFLIIFCNFIALLNGAPKNRTCIQYSEKGIKYDSEQDDEEFDYTTLAPEKDEIEVINEIVECPLDFDFCYNIWRIGINATRTIVKRGCWQDSSEINTNCNQESCIGTPQAPPNGNLYFCCCNGNSCNKNMSEDNSTKTDKESISNGTQSFVTADFQPLWMSPIFLAFLSFISIIIVGIACFVSCRQPVPSSPEASPLSPSGPGYSSNLQNVDNLKVLSMIGQGKYGTVWKGLINEQAVAVKIFPAHHKQYFINERNIYSLPLMDCPSILAYYGCDERRTLDDHVEHFLVLSLAPLGCLQDWLIHNTSDYSIFCKMAKSLCRGVSHLHTELQCGDDLKPCVCHRDLNTRNILVKNDLSCCIADFGFALKTFGSRYEYKGEMALAETKSLAEVGTLRYMAPEILEGAVNLRDCETALKQIDVYSLGLILWELGTRCQDLFAQGQTVPSYKAPYENEIGKNPSFEQMQVLVARHKARPLFLSGWGGGPAGKLIKDTCEDCWDHDAEARLTALCAEERVCELFNIRPKSHISRGPSPPINANNLSRYNSSNFRSISLCNTPETGVVLTPPNQILPRVRSCSSDTGSTVINLGSPSGIEKNHKMFAQQIQPYQGRNPCQERNLAIPTNRQNQILVEKSKKHSFLDHNSQEKNLSCLEDDVCVEDLLTNNCHKMDDSSILGEGFPKQNNTDKKLKGWYGVRALIQKKLFRKESSSLLSTTTPLQSIDINYNDEKTNLVDNRLANCTIINMASPTKEITVNFVDCKTRNTNGSCSSSGHIQTIVENGNISSSVSLSNRRPSNLDLVPITVRINGLSPEYNKSNLIRNLNKDEECTFKQPIKLQSLIKNPSSIKNELTNNIMTYTKDQPRLVVSRSANAVKNLNNSSSTALEDGKITRQRSLEMFKEVFSGKGSTERLRDPSQRVKTPGDVPPSVRKVRASKTLSLYDDRMMDSAGLNIL